MDILYCLLKWIINLTLKLKMLLLDLLLRRRAVEGIPQLADLARGEIGLALLLRLLVDESSVAPHEARIDVRLHPPHRVLSLAARKRGERVPELFDAVGVAAVEGVDEGLHGKLGLGHCFGTWPESLWSEAERTRHVDTHDVP